MQNRIIIEKINDNEHVEYKGDVYVTGNVGKNARIIIFDGSLIVGGDIQANTTIKLTARPRSFLGCVCDVSINEARHMLNVHGNVEDSVILFSQNADLVIHGNVGHQCKLDTFSGNIQAGSIGNGANIKTMSGDVIVRNVGRNCIIHTMSGDVKTEMVGSHSTVKTMSGDVKTEMIGSHSTVKTMSGDIKTQGTDNSITFETMSGNIYENGGRRYRRGF